MNGIYQIGSHAPIYGLNLLLHLFLYSGPGLWKFVRVRPCTSDFDKNIQLMCRTSQQNMQQVAEQNDKKVT